MTTTQPDNQTTEDRLTDIRAVISKTEATELINEGTYRVINDQAIEWVGRD